MFEDATTLFQAGLFEDINKIMRPFWFCYFFFFLVIFGWRGVLVACEYMLVSILDSYWYFIIYPLFQFGLYLLHFFVCLLFLLGCLIFYFSIFYVLIRFSSQSFYSKEL
jgi:hypothetical protein